MPGQRWRSVTCVQVHDVGHLPQQPCLHSPLHCHPPPLPSRLRNQTCGDYIVRAAKVITLVDLAGHERYFRTTAYGLTGKHLLLHKAQPFNLFCCVSTCGAYLLRLYRCSVLVTCSPVLWTSVRLSASSNPQDTCWTAPAR